jgi:hypothetical protein
MKILQSIEHYPGKPIGGDGDIGSVVVRMLEITRTVKGLLEAYAVCGDLSSLDLRQQDANAPNPVWMSSWREVSKLNNVLWEQIAAVWLGCANEKIRDLLRDPKGPFPTAYKRLDTIEDAGGLLYDKWLNYTRVNLLVLGQTTTDWNTWVTTPNYTGTREVRTIRKVVRDQVNIRFELNQDKGTTDSGKIKDYRMYITTGQPYGHSAMYTASSELDLTIPELCEVMENWATRSAARVVDAALKQHLIGNAEFPAEQQEMTEIHRWINRQIFHTAKEK